MKRIIISIFAMFFIIASFGQTTIKLSKTNGIYSLPCTVNGKQIPFYFDPGAADIVISAKFYLQAVKDGILKTTDLLPEIVNYKVATGEIHSGRRINIRELGIGNLRLNNVIGSIIEGSDSPFLLGQSALEKFGSYTIDNSTSTLHIKGNFQSDIDVALEAAKKKAADQLKAAGQGGMMSLLQQQIQQTKVDILRDKKIANGLEFEVYNIEVNRSNDEWTFKYDITNNSGIDYKNKAFSQLHIFIDVFTEDGKVYSASTSTEYMLAGNTVNGEDLRIKMRNKKPKYFRLYGVVNGPLLSTIESTE